MANYAPIPKADHLKRGHCCKNFCFYCPWYAPKHHEMIVNPAIESALRSGETVTIYSNRASLVPSVTLQDRVTIVYLGYIDPNTDHVQN